MAAARSLTDLLDAAKARGPDERLAGLDDAALEHEVRGGAARLAAETCRWLLLVAELVRRGIWAEQGFVSPGSWLAWAVSMGASTAREHVRVALSLGEWPALSERFAAGEISYSKVRVITRYGDPAAEELLLRYAEHADGAQLERILRAFDTAAQVAWDDTTAFDRRDVSVRDRSDGMSELRLVAPTEVVERIQQVLTERAWQLRAEQRREAAEAAEIDGVEPAAVESIGAHRADVLVAAIEAVAESMPADASGADRHTVVIHVHTGDGIDEEITDPDPTREPERVPVQVRTSSGWRSRSMSPRTLARLACQAGLVAARHDDAGELVAMSARNRRVPPRMLRALRARDKRCRYPGCGSTRFVDAHHIVHVADGGATSMDNLVLLCVRHHHHVHDRDVTIVHDGRGRMRFVLADGRTLDPSPHLDATLAGASAEALPTAACPDGGAALQPTAYQARIDLAACVEVLLAELDLLDLPRHLTAAA